MDSSGRHLLGSGVDVLPGYEVALTDYDTVLLVTGLSSPVVTHADVLSLPHELLHSQPVLALLSLLQVELEVVFPQLLYNLDNTNDLNNFP